MRRQLFILDREMLALVGQKALQETYEEMVAEGLAQPPYESYTIQVPMGAVIRSNNQGTLDEMAEQGDERALRLHDAPLQIVIDKGNFAIQVSDHRHKNWVTLEYFMAKNAKLYATFTASYSEQLKTAATHLQALLIVLLDTSNVERHVTHNRLARLGVGKQQYEYVTTLKLGRIPDAPRGDAPHFTGQTRCPHLRRSHIRRQHYGPNNSYVKKVRIAAIFVNGYDPNEGGGRVYYNVKLRKGPK